MATSSRIVYPGSPPKQKKRMPRWALRLWVLLGSLAILITGIWYLFHLRYFRISGEENIAVRGTFVLSASEVARVTLENISGSYAGIIPRDNLVVVSPQRLERELLRKFPQLSGVTISKDFPHTLVVVVEERALWGAYCVRQTGGGRPCWYLDRHGTAYEEISSLAGWLLPIIIGESSVKLGASAVAEDTLILFDKTRDVLGALSIRPLTLAISSTTPTDGRISTEEGWDILITTPRPPQEWAGVLKTILEKEVGPKRLQLDYVDLRFGNKVFYKYR